MKHELSETADKAKEEARRRVFQQPEWNSNEHPSLGCVSPGMVSRIIPTLRSLPTRTELVRIPVKIGDSAMMAAIGTFNMTWQSGAAVGTWRFWGMEREELPLPIRRVLDRAPDDTDVRFIPKVDDESAAVRAEYGSLIQLLPLHRLRQFSLPYCARETWPTAPFRWPPAITGNGRERVAHAFAEHVWPLLCTQSPRVAFSRHEPLHVLSHGLDFWLPYADAVVRRRLRERGALPFRTQRDRRDAKRMEREHPDLVAEPPVAHATAWEGEADAWEATKEIVAEADAAGRLRGLVDAIKSHRVQDDFSDRWSFAKEDFERKLHRKRSRWRVTFVELPETLPVHGPDAEFAEQELWQTFLATLSERDRRITIAIRGGTTRLGDIAADLGYANHSAVSKALKAIRRKLTAFIGS